MSDFKRVLANAGWNLLGTVLPLVVAVVAVPFLLHRIGAERLGLLSLAWVLIGYFSLFDLGLGRALTKMVALHAEPGAEAKLSALCSTGMALVGMLGLAGGLLVAAAIPFSDLWIKPLPQEMHDEARHALVLIALGVPLVVGTAALRGILEGFQRFRLLNAIRVPAGVALFLAPCASAWFSPRLDWAIGALLVTRLVVLAAHVLPCASLVHLAAAKVQREWVAPLLHFGGWLTVSSVLGPVIVYIDRFVIGAMLSAASMAYYSAPFDIVSRLLLIPVALTGALFPALTRAQGADPLAAQRLRKRSLQLTLLVVVPLAALGALIAEPAVRLWLGAEFAAQSAGVMRILLLGFVFNAAAQIPFAAMQGHGLTRQTALLHLIELPVYVTVLILLVQSHGLEGAAVAWALRALIDWAGLTWLLHAFERRQLSANTIPSTDARLRHET